MVDDRLHALGQLLTWRRHDLAVRGLDRAAGETIQRLMANGDALAHLGYSNQIAVVAVADCSGWHGERVVLVTAIRIGLAQVEREPGGAQDGAAHPQSKRVFSRKHADTQCALAK